MRTESNAVSITTPLVLALDIGTSSTRALVYDLTGNPLRIDSRCQYQMKLTANGGVEIEPETLLDKLYRNIDEVISALGQRAEAISAVAISTFWHSLLGIDLNGNPTTPIISWNDTRSAAYAQQLRQQFDDRINHQRTGCRWHACYWPAKLRWLAAEHQQQFRATSHWLSLADYLWLQLFGEITTSISLASGTGLFNQKECDWDAETLAAVPIDRASLPPISEQSRQGLRAEFAARWPALKDIPWFLALGDGACNNIGSGCYEPSRFALMIGTSAAMRAVVASDQFSIPAELWCYRLDRRRIVMGGALSNGGNLYAWLKETLDLPLSGMLETELAKLPPDGHGLTFLPLLSGERSPGWHDNASATIAGLKLSSRPVEIMRAGLEAVALQFAILYQALAQQLGEPAELIATGGALYASSNWRQILADCLGVPLRVCAVAEASSRGAALMALETLQLIQPLTKDSHSDDELVESHQPVPQHYQVYQGALRRYRALYQLLVEQDWTEIDSTKKIE